MEAADSGSLLIRAPVSLPEEKASAFSDEEDFFLSGEEDNGADFEEISKPVILQKVPSMPKAPVTGEDDDEVLADEEDDGSSPRKAFADVIEENGHSNGDGEVLEEKGSVEDSSSKEILPVGVQVDEIDEEEKPLEETGISTPAAGFSGDPPSEKIVKEGELQGELVSSAPENGPPANELQEEVVTADDGIVKERKLQEDLVVVAPEKEFSGSKEEEIPVDKITVVPVADFSEDSLAVETREEGKSWKDPVTLPTSELPQDSLADEEKSERKIEEDLASSIEVHENAQTDETSIENKFPGDSQFEETSLEKEFLEELVAAGPPTEFHEDSRVDETNKDDETSKASEPSLSCPVESHEDSQIHGANEEIELQEDLITPVPPDELHEDPQIVETGKDSNSLTSSTEFHENRDTPERVSSETREAETSDEQSLTSALEVDGTRKERLVNEGLEYSGEDELADLIDGLISRSFDAVIEQENLQPTASETEEEKPVAVDVEESKIFAVESKSDDQESSTKDENGELEKVLGDGDSERGPETDVLQKEEKEDKSKHDEDRNLLVQEDLVSLIKDSDEDLDPIEDNSEANEDEDIEIEESAKFKEKVDDGSLVVNRVVASTDEYSDGVDGQIVSFSDEEDSDEENDGKELFDSAALTALLKAASGASSNGEITFTAPDGTRLFSVERPAGLGSSIPPLKPAAPRPNRSNIFSPTDLSLTPETEAPVDEEEKKLQEKVDQIKVKFLRLVHRLGHSPEDRVVAQVLYRLSLAEGIRRGRQMSRAFSLENAKKKALELEEGGKEPLHFSCNILLLGKTGVGKSALVNSIFGEQKVSTSAFDMSTNSVKEVSGIVDGVNVRIIDTPGLRPSVMDQATNMKILNSIKKHTKRCPPDIVLYVDRLDTQAWDFNDLPLLRSIATSMGPAIWFNAIVALTHGASAPPDGSTGTPLSYEVFVDQRSRVVQHAIRQAAGDMRLMNPVSLVENHPSCRRNREGQRILPNGLSWRSQLLLLCYSSKILSEANSILKLQDSSPSKLFGFRTRSPPLPFLLSSLLQSKPHPKLTSDQGVDQGDSDFDLDDLDEEVKDGEEEEEDEYDQLPPFKPLRKSQLAKLTKDQRRAYFDEYEYRVKLLQKKQWKDELRRARERKKRVKQGQELPIPDDNPGDYDDDSSAPATIPVPLPDMVLPPSFDCDNPAFRYRFLEPSSQLLTRPVLDSHGWDHDCGYDGVSLEDNLSIAGKYPTSISAQITKDKKDFTIHVDSSIAAIHGENGSTLAGFDVQSVGKQLAYILRSETKFKTLKKNKAAAGVSVTFLGENIAAGMKLEDELAVGKRFGISASAGTMRSKGDAAYGANVEIRIRDKEFPVGQDLSTLGLSLMRWRGDLALGANLQSQFSVGRGSKMAIRFGLNNKRSGQFTVKLNSSEQLQIALMGIIPVAASIYRSFFSEE